MSKQLTTKQFYIGLFLFLSMIILFLHTRRQGADSIHYLAWGHSMYFDADLFLLNQFDALRAPYFFTPTGFVGELRNFGTAIFWLPFYALYSTTAFLWPNPTEAMAVVDGPNQLLFINWSTFLFVFLSLGLMIDMLRKFFSVAVTWLTVTSLFFGTPLLFYTIQRPTSSHPTAVLLASLFLWLWLKNPKTLWRYFGLGILAGWLMVVASFNVVLLVLPLSTLFLMFISNRNWRELSLRGSVLGIGILLGFLPQMLVWYMFYGSFVASPYSGQLQWLNPQVQATLFSPFHGLFVYAPLLFVAIAGLLILSRQNKILAFGLGLTWLGLIYIVSANLAWWAGASFGNRYFLVLSPLYALMIGALLQHSLRWLWLIGPCVVWSVGLWLQTLDGTLKIGDAHFYTLPTLLKNQMYSWQNIPFIFQSSDEHWIVSTPWPIVIGILFLSVIVFLLGGQGLRALGKVSSGKEARVLGLLGVTFVGVVIVLLRRSESQINLLAETGFYDKPHRVSTYDPGDLSRTYLDRAKYYQATNQPEYILSDLQAATRAWYSPSRQILDLVKVASPELTQAVDLQYGQEIRLLGFVWENRNSRSGELILYWQKLANETENTYIPFVQLLDANGILVWEGKVDDPFPAHHIPAGYIFYDHLRVEWHNGTSTPSPLWLKIEFPIENLTPMTATGELHSGVFSLNNLPPRIVSPILSIPKNSLRVIKAKPLASTFRPGDSVDVYLIWQGNGEMPSKVEVHFVDEKGTVVLMEMATLLSNDALKPNFSRNPFLSDILCLHTPPSLTPGKYQLYLVNESTKSGRSEDIPITTIVIRNESQIEQFGTICDLINLRRVERIYRQPAADDARITFTSLANLMGYDLDLEPAANELQGEITFRWQSLLNNPPPAQPKLRLVNAEGKKISEFTWTPVWGTRPTKYWFKDEIITDTVQFPIPKLPAGNYKLLLEWQNRVSGELLKTGDGQTYTILEEFSKQS